MSLQGTLQIVVSLKSPSVEYSRESGDNRYSRTLGGDGVSATEAIAAAKKIGITDLSETQILEGIFAQASKSIVEVNSQSTFPILRGGNKVTIQTDDISFITLKTDGVFRNIQDAAK